MRLINMGLGYDSLEFKAELRNGICAAVQPLTELLRNQDFDIRKEAAASLGKLVGYGEFYPRIFVIGSL